MAIPDFQTVMRPLLEFLTDGHEYSNTQLYDFTAKKFGVSAVERSERIPSGRARTLDNRVAWALTYLRAVKATSSPKRGLHQITQRGHDLFRDNPQRVDMKVLEQFPEYAEFTGKNRSTGHLASIEVVDAGSLELVPTIVVTPEEAMAGAYKAMRASLAQELLDKVKSSPPEFFEQLVVDVLLAMGYGGSQRDAGQTLGRSGDGGIDGVIREDKLGLDVVYLQAKRWEGPVGRPVVQGFFGTIHGANATKGVIITTSTFTQGARDYVKTISTRIVLVDGKELVELMIDHNVAVSHIQSYDLKRVDNDYFAEL